MADEIQGFSFVSRTPSSVYCHQGVATDGTYFYTTDGSSIYKFNSAWVLQATRTNARSYGTPMRQVNSIYIKDGKLYIGSSNYNYEPRAGYIKVFNCSDLSYVEEHRVLDHWSEGCAFHDNCWWAIYTDLGYVSKYDSFWVHQADYELTYPVTGHHYQGIRWIGNHMYVNLHAGSAPQKLDCYYWNGSGFTEVSRLDRPSIWCTQGIEWDGTHFWWAERNYGYPPEPTGDHRVLKSIPIFGIPELCYWIDAQGGPTGLDITDVFTIIDSYLFETPPIGYTFIPTLQNVFGVIDYYLGFNGDANTGCNYYP